MAHARRFRAEGLAPAPPRVAATVVLLRPVPVTGFEVYVIRRAATMTFGGMYAFPGGGVDPADSGPDPGLPAPASGLSGPASGLSGPASGLSGPDSAGPAPGSGPESVRVGAGLGWSGPDRSWWGDRLGLAPGPAQAVVCAAAREVFEEAGVLLAGPGPDTVVGDVSDDGWEADRRALVAREVGFAELLQARGLTLRSDLLLPWSRWVTPEFEPRRFDTYFFVALLPVGQRTRDVSGEADHTLWISPTQALARAEAGEMAMLLPTVTTLMEVAVCADLAALPAAAAARDASRPIMPRLTESPDGIARFALD
nr:NUDIX hydrolase [Micromonospora sp. DSM 115978]